MQGLLRYRPPVLEVAETPAFSEARDLSLRGVAKFAPGGGKRRMVYVFRGRDKVFFRAAESQPQRPDSRRDEAALEFTTTIPLELGRNEMTVVAREGDESVARTLFVVYRTR